MNLIQTNFVWTVSFQVCRHNLGRENRKIRKTEWENEAGGVRALAESSSVMKHFSGTNKKVEEKIWVSENSLGPASKHLPPTFSFSGWWVEDFKKET